MRTLSASRRQALRLTVAVTVATGVAFAAYTLGSSAGANSSDLPLIVPATSSSTSSSTATDPGAPDTPAPEPATSSPLTLDQATAVATQLAPGQVIKWDEDHEPTGLRYDITLLHDNGSTTDVEVDTVTGQVTSVDHDNDGD
jgi:uncharacterized membrane protein YkoI